MESNEHYTENEHVNTSPAYPAADAAPTPASATASIPYPTTDSAASPHPVPAPAQGPTAYTSAATHQHPSPPPYPQPDKQHPPTTGQAPRYGYRRPPARYAAQPRYGTPQYAAAAPPPQVVLVSVRQPQQPVIVQYAPSYIGHMILACTVFLCCNWLFGLIAFILASQYTLFSTIKR